MTKLNERMTRAAIALTLLVAGCGMPGSAADDENIGQVRLAIEIAPSDALCLRLTAESDTSGLEVVKTVALTAGKPSTAQVAGLPLGNNVTFVGEVFGVACASVVATTPLTWTSDKVTLALAADTIPLLYLPLHKAGKVNVGVDFLADAVSEYVTLPGIPAKIAAAPDNTVYLTLTSGGVYHASNTFDATRFGSTPSPARLVAVAADGTVLVTSSPGTTSAHTLMTFTPAGVLKTSTPLGFQAGKMIVDAANTAWIGSVTGPQVMRVATVTTAPTTQLLTIGGGSTAPGVALAPDKTVRFTGAPGYVASYSAAGVSTGILGLPIVPKDLTVAADGSVWAIATSSGTTGNLLVHLLTDGTTQPLFVGTNQTIPDVGIVTTSKGILYTQPTGGLGLLTPTNGFQAVNLPENAIATSLAVLPNGKIWAGDSRKARAFIVTLP
jgi:hypothetical protein